MYDMITHINIFKRVIFFHSRLV